MHLFAQTDTLVQLPTVEIIATTLRSEQPGSFWESWSSASLLKQNGSSLAEFLQNESGIYLKSYGGGSLATTTIRGASASQTAVLWNGFQVQSPMLGLLDWSLIPTHFADEVSLQHGGNSSVWGSGAVGGAVLIENKPDFNAKRQFHLSTGIGSFGWRNGQLSAKFATQKLAFSTNIFYQKSENNFSYQPAPSTPLKKQTNAAQRQAGLMQALYWRPSTKHLLSWQTWLQSAYREIPPTTTQTRSEANQEDIIMRTALHWKFAVRKSLLQARSAIFKEKIRYRDPASGLDAPSHFWTSISEVDFQRQFSSKITLQFTGNQTFTQGFTKFYTEPAKRHQSAVFASLRYSDSLVSAQIDGRLELVDGKMMPFTPSIGLDRKLLPWLNFGAKLSRNYRLPTLNDLYWQPGGNPNLLAETGWSEELNLHFNYKQKQMGFGFTTAVFNRNIKNWVLWHPKEGQAFWSASNLAEVWSRGIENRLHFSWTQSFLELKLDAGYDFIRSTNQQDIAIPKIEAGQQLIYVPENQGFAKVQVELKSISVGYRHQFIGSVLTELGSLPSFQIGSVSIELERPVHALDARFFFQIDNCWNTNYRVIERRPMPGRSFEIGCSINFIKN